MGYGDKLDDIIETAVARGKRPGVAAVVSFLCDRGWGYGVSVTEWGYSREDGSGAAWTNVPDRDAIAVVLTQRTPDETGMPAVCDDVLAVARATA